jgi:hypothetical protein
VYQQHLSGGGELHGPAATWPLEQRRAHDTFQDPHLLAHR